MNQSNQPPRRSNYELDERASEAMFVLNHPLLKEAMDHLRIQYMEEMTAAPTGSESLINAHAKLKVLGDVQAHLKSIITDKKMADKKGVSYGR